MAYAQWIYVLIQNKIRDATLIVKNAHLNWGKFYQWDNKDNEISSQSVDKVTVQYNGSGGVASCGRSDAASGTEGSFDIYDGDVKVCHIYWDCPWGGKTNTFTVSDVNEEYVVQATGANLNSGAIGQVTVKVVKI